MITVIKNIRMFAYDSRQESFCISKDTAFFVLLSDVSYLKNKLLKSLRIVVLYCTQLVLGGIREASSFLYFIMSKFHSMPRTNEICRRSKYSKPSTTSGARHALVQYFTENYPAVKRLKIKDHKRFFVARARYGQRVLYAKAYSLERLTEYFRQEFETKVLGKEAVYV